MIDFAEPMSESENRNPAADLRPEFRPGRALRIAIREIVNFLAKLDRDDPHFQECRLTLAVLLDINRRFERGETWVVPEYFPAVWYAYRILSEQREAYPKRCRHRDRLESACIFLAVYELGTAA